MAKCYDAMTNQEAIKELKFHCVNCLGNQEEGYCENYCEYGIALEALEKQIPKKPLVRVFTTITLKDGSEYAMHNYYCPMCWRVIIQGYGCSNNDCRQCIDWEDDND